jgi:hypothetical protein
LAGEDVPRRVSAAAVIAGSLALEAGSTGSLGAWSGHSGKGLAQGAVGPERGSVVVLEVLLQRLVIGEVGPACGAGRLNAGIGGELDEDAVPGIAVLTKEPQGLVVGFSDFEEALAELKHAVIDPKGDRAIEM